MFETLILPGVHRLPGKQCIVVDTECHYRYNNDVTNILGGRKRIVKMQREHLYEWKNKSMKRDTIGEDRGITL
ncbi:hypothetical protein [Salimicrobium flavidum]|nr:hypothetical protein [Salimicrobium flavidum]